MALGPVVATALALPAISSPLSIESVRVHGCGALMEEREAQTERVAVATQMRRLRDPAVATSCALSVRRSLASTSGIQDNGSNGTTVVLRRP
jgi:hypothetical protein